MKRLLYIMTVILAAVAVAVIWLPSCDNRERLSLMSAVSMKEADSLLLAGHYQSALKGYVEALRQAESEGNDTVKGHSLNRIGTIYAYHDDFQKAISYYERGYATAMEAGDTLTAGSSVVNLIMMAKSTGDKDMEQRYKELFRTMPSAGGSDHEYYLHYIEFLSYLESGRDSGIMAELQPLLRICDNNDRGGDAKATLYNHLGMRYAEREMADSALWCYRTAIRLLDNTGNASRRQAVYTNLCRLFEALGERDSMILYRGKMVEASDSFFNLRDFSREKEKLDIYERDKTQHHIDELRRRVWYAAILVFAVGVVLIVILVYSKKIDRARMALVSRNETLLKENERLRDQLAGTLVKEVPAPEPLMAHEGQKSESETADEEDQTAGGEKKLQISVELRKSLESRILAIMNDRSTVFSPDFNINMLALALGTNTRYVSEVVKGLGASNFRNFINEYRIREACRRLADTKGYGHLTIAAIAGEVGFNSDNSFLLAFKRIMGMTPTRYRELAGKMQDGQTPSL